MFLKVFESSKWSSFSGGNRKHIIPQNRQNLNITIQFWKFMKEQSDLKGALDFSGDSADAFHFMIFLWTTSSWECPLGYCIIIFHLSRLWKIENARNIHIFNK